MRIKSRGQAPPRGGLQPTGLGARRGSSFQEPFPQRRPRKLAGRREKREEGTGEQGQAPVKDRETATPRSRNSNKTVLEGIQLKVRKRPWVPAGLPNSKRAFSYGI